MFLERLGKEPDSVPTFLLLAILSVSARFTPSLVRRYGDEAKATEVFLKRAETMVPDEMYKPTLERTQAFVSAVLFCFVLRDLADRRPCSSSCRPQSGGRLIMTRVS